MRRPNSKVIAGIDLHGNSVVIGVIDQDGKRIEHRKVDTDLKQVEGVLKPYKTRLISMAVKSTFNWYWLVDGLRARGYSIDLANPARIEQYNRIKHADDKHDAIHLAELQRLRILPKGYIYDPQLRPVLDVLRRRSMLVHHRTALLVSFKSLYTRTTGGRMTLNEVKSMEPAGAAQLYEHPANLIARIQVEQIDRLDESIERIEKAVLGCAKDIPLYSKLLTLPGVGKILGMTITMEVGDIKRLQSDGNFASYCRAVAPRRMSNGKQKGENNQKCGNGHGLEREPRTGCKRPGSLRFKRLKLRHRSNHARTRWVTERIASRAEARERSGIKRTKTQARVRMSAGKLLRPQERTGRDKKPGWATFFLFAHSPNGRPLFRTDPYSATPGSRGPNQ